jgi:hypothetical protein
MNVVIMWLGLAFFITALCLAAGSGAFAKKTERRALPTAGHTRLQRLAKLLFFIGILLWIFGAVLMAGHGK